MVMIMMIDEDCDDYDHDDDDDDLLIATTMIRLAHNKQKCIPLVIELLKARGSCIARQLHLLSPFLFG